MDADFPMTKGWIWAMCLLLTPFCGSFLYYGLRAKHPAAAKYANQVSFASWLLWLAFALAGHTFHLL